MEPSAPALGVRIYRFLLIATIIGVLIGGALFARRNLRLGRGDRRGASTLAIFILATLLVEWVLKVHHVPDLGEMQSFIFRGLSFSVLISCLSWVFYLALEPYVRRLWPEVLISWVRLLDKRFRDPLVGRDVLFGLLAGLAFMLLGQAWPLASRWLGLPIPALDAPPFWMEFENLSGLRFSLANLFELQAASLFFSFVDIVSLLLLRAALRRQWLAVVGFILLWSLLSSLSSANPYVSLIFLAVNVTLWLVVFLRLGLLPILVAGFFNGLLALYPMTLDFSSWYVANTFLVLLVAAALAAYGFRVSMAGRAVFRDAVFQD